MKNVIYILIFIIILTLSNSTFAEIQNFDLKENTVTKSTEMTCDKLDLSTFEEKTKVTIIIPAFYEDGSKINDSIIDEIEVHFVEIAGGFTLQKSFGRWQNKDNKIITDKNYSFYILIDDCRVNDLLEYVSKLKTVLKQEAIYFEISKVKVNFI